MEKGIEITTMVKLYDVIIIGGGPAGLNAAVVLGRCNRSVLLFDHAQQRNRHSHGMHNYLTRDGITPSAFLDISRKEVKKYGVTIVDKEVVHANKMNKKSFEVITKGRNKYHSKKLILATGLADILPPFPEAKSFYGKSMHHCPYCDGWEYTGKKIAVYSKTRAGIDLAITLSRWSNDITIFTDGKKYGSKKERDLICTLNIEMVTSPVKHLEGRNGKLKYIVTENGNQYKCDGLFFTNGYEVQCDIVESLGCTMGKNNVAITNKSQQTNIYGLYVVGDASRDMHFVVVAAAEGAKAAVYINKELTIEEINTLQPEIKKRQKRHA